MAPPARSGVQECENSPCASAPVSRYICGRTFVIRRDPRARFYPARPLVGEDHREALLSLGEDKTGETRRRSTKKLGATQATASEAVVLIEMVSRRDVGAALCSRRPRFEVGGDFEASVEFLEEALGHSFAGFEPRHRLAGGST